MSINCTHSLCKFYYDCQYFEDNEELNVPEPTEEQMEEYEERKRRKQQEQGEY